MVPIEDVQAGDLVWSYNQATQEWELREVEVAFEHIYFGDIVTLTIQHEDGSRESIEATGNHPFWIVEGEALADRPLVEELPAHESVATPTGRWTEARHLRLGDHFLTLTGKSATVVGLTIRTERVKVYNLQVAELHLYAVGEHGVLVHNSNAYNRYGTWIHQRWNLGPGFIRHFRLPSGRVVDAINFERRIIKELKPNNPRAIAQGYRQLEAYRRELERVLPGDRPWRVVVETYDRPWWFIFF